MSIRLSEITEGESRLLVPRDGRLTKKDPVFYNPEMELSRDMSVGVASAAKAESFCDLLAGTGARGVRIAKETGAAVLCNDLNPLAFDLIEKNKELNCVDVEVAQLDGNKLLAERRFDFIDIDPFGSPVAFIDSAVRAVNNRGILAVTATDTAALCGTSPRACLRKYDALSLRTDYYNELALRILIGHVARSAARHGRGIAPLFSHCTRHYFRAYLQVVRGSGKANSTREDVGYIQHCFACLWRGFSALSDLECACSCGAKVNTAGPLWTGAFADADFCGDLVEEIGCRPLGRKKEALKLVEMVGAEQGVLTPYYNVHKVAGKLGLPVLPMDEIVRGLEVKGFKAFRTHFSGFGLRTDAGLNELQEVISHYVK